MASTLRRWIFTTVLRSKPGSLKASEAASNAGSLSKPGTWNSLAKELNDGAGAALASVGEIETIRLYPDHEGALRLVLGVDPKAFRPNSLLHCNMEMVNALCKEKYASLLSSTLRKSGGVLFPRGNAQAGKHAASSKRLASGAGIFTMSRHWPEV